MSNKDLKIKTVDLVKIINKMVSLNPDIQSIHLFGSRAYLTHSRRSDFDIIIYSKPNTNLDRRALKLFASDYSFLDIFIGSFDAIVSLSNDSSITKREGYESILKQLDAVELWNANQGFVNESKVYLTQELTKDASFPPSELNNNDPAYPISKFAKKYSSQLDKKKKTFLSSAIISLFSNNPLAFIALVGSFFERTLLDLFEAYNDRVIAKSLNQTTYERDVLQNTGDRRSGIYPRMLAFVGFINANEIPNNGKEFYKNYFAGENGEFIKTTFDIVRRFRNEVDHSLEYNFAMNDCYGLIQMFSKHLPIIYDAIQLLKNNPSI